MHTLQGKTRTGDNQNQGVAATHIVLAQAAHILLCPQLGATTAGNKLLHDGAID
jgi:hypothetical protein